MGISAKELEVNTKHINELADQIRYNTDCEVIRLVIEEHLDSLEDLLKDIKEEQKELLSKLLPLLDIPGPNPIAIVKWISKFTTGLVTPQLLAHIKYTKKLIQLVGAILNVVSAIEVASQTLPQCAIDIKNDALDQIRIEVNGLVTDALQEIAGSQLAILAIVDAGNTVQRIDTSSATAFLATVDRAAQEITTAVDLFRKQP